MFHISEFLVALRAIGRSSNTVRVYGWHLGRLEAWLREAGVEGVGGLSRSVLRAWAAGIREAWAPATCRQAVVAARSWLRWLGAEGLSEGSLVSALGLPAVPVRVQRTLSVEEVRRMLAACDPGSVIGRRDAAAIALLVDSGLRAGELCRLEVSRLEVAGLHLVVEVKGGREAFGYFGESTGRRLRAWLEVRAAASGVGTVFVAVGGSRPGWPLTTRGLRGALRRVGDRAGVPDVSVHAFRRSFACIMTEAGAPGRVVQIAGRWSNLQMVERYTAAMASAGGAIVRPYLPTDRLE